MVNQRHDKKLRLGDVKVGRIGVGMQAAFAKAGAETRLGRRGLQDTIKRRVKFGCEVVAKSGFLPVIPEPRCGQVGADVAGEREKWLTCHRRRL